jgi:glycosyltransferase involved in cell wall biosynthesis
MGSLSCGSINYSLEVRLLQSGASIIIPCYNSGEYLREAVESAMAQDMGVELVVVDDGSNDPRTISVLDSLRSEGIRVHRQENKGLPEARNAGIRLTSAEYVVCLDADDILKPAYCSACREILQSRTDIGFVFSTTQVFGTQNKLWSKARYSGLHLLVNNYIPYSAMFRRQLWEQAGGYSGDMRGGYEDWDYWLSALEKGWKGYHIAQPLFLYRKHGKSMLSSSNTQRRRLKRLIQARHPDLFSFKGLKPLLAEEKFLIPRFLYAWAREEFLENIYRPIKKYRGIPGK